MFKNEISKMTFEEKAQILTGFGSMETFGIERLNIPSKKLADGPHGVREEKGQNCTHFPNLCSLASSWSKETAYKMGKALAADCKEHGIDMLLGPGVNIKRNILCGRNFEYMSEDPYLAGEMAAGYINGLQDGGVAASLKHYAANSQEKYRLVISAEIDERTLREIYLKPFEIAVKKSNPVSIMCAYNKINSVWCSENKFLYDILKNEWDFKGFVISDWGAVHDPCRAFSAGMDLQMPKNSKIVEQLKEGIKNGDITEEIINEAVSRVLKFSMMKKCISENYNRDDLHKTARQIASDGIVLLKNDENILPITSGKYKKIAVVGEYAKSPLICGQGSAEVHQFDEYTENPLDELKKQLGDVEIKYVEAYKKGEYSSNMLWPTLDTFANSIRDCDLVVFFMGSMLSEDTENFDRNTARLNPNFEMFVNCAVNNKKKTVVVLQSGGALILDELSKKADAIVEMWLGGEAAGGAVADVLCGAVNPSGKLTETFPNKLRCDLDYPGDVFKTVYNEKLDVGYRYYDKHPEEVVYPFGHGLSYTKFEYSDFKAEINGENVNIELNVKNTGDFDGSEVVQIYVSDPVSTVTRPIKELKAFEKVFVEKGKTKKVEINFPVSYLAYYNIMLKDWVVENGVYNIYAASSANDIRLEESVVYNGKMPYTMQNTGEAMIG